MSPTPSRRPGATLPEVLVAAGVLAVVLAGAWAVFGLGGRAGHQVVRYGDILQAAATIQARLEQDLAAAYVPPGVTPSTPAFRLAEDGRSLTFLRSGVVEDLRAPGLHPAPRKWVHWTTEEGPGGTWILRRVDPELGTIAWESAPLKALRFELFERDERVFLAAEMLLVDADQAANEAGGRRALPLRVVRRLRGPARLPAGLVPYPEALLGELPEASGAPVGLIPDAGSDVQLVLP